jgi:hypothetical protein
VPLKQKRRDLVEVTISYYQTASDELKKKISKKVIRTKKEMLLYPLSIKL